MFFFKVREVEKPTRENYKIMKKNMIRLNGLMDKRRSNFKDFLSIEQSLKVKQI
jgi:hypothetical protein